MKCIFNKTRAAAAALALILFAASVFTLTGCAVPADDSSANAAPIVLEATSGSAAASQEAPQDNAQYSLSTIRKVPDFNAVDQYGDPVDQSVFADADYTLLVFWATWCGPCVAEIPELVGAHEELMGMNVQIVGICEDGKGDRESALDILQANDAAYVNIMPDDQFYDDFVSLCFTYPSAMLIDSNGNVVQNQFSLERDADAIVTQIGKLLGSAGTTSAPSVSGAQNGSDPIVAFYDEYKENMLEHGYTESSTRIANISTFIELHKKAYAYTTDRYFARIDIEINGEKQTELRSFVTDGSYRQEEYSNGKIAYVTIYNGQTDEYVQYEVASGNTNRISNASYMGGGIYSEIYTLTPNVAFDASIFTFDASMLSADTKGN
jgi:thiol-disulfide isomerase/thioredoxin